MTTTLLTLLLRRPRDLLLARQRARQIARLLRFDLREQAAIAAAVFTLARSVGMPARPGALQFRLVGDQFQVLAMNRGVATAAQQSSNQRSTAAGKQIRSSSHRLMAYLLHGAETERRPSRRFEVPLPDVAELPARQDIAWVVSTMHRLAPFNAMEEIERQNQELLDAWRDLQRPLTSRPGQAERPAA